MIKLYLLVLIFIGSIYIGFAQKTKAELILKDSTHLIGLGKLTNKGQIKFRKTKKDKPIKYDFSDLAFVKIEEYDGAKEYVQKPVKDRTTPEILTVIKKGKVNLYKTIFAGYNYAPPVGPNGFGAGGVGVAYSINHFYVSKEGEEEVTHLGSTHIFSKNFKKAASEYFKDCPVLVEKIQVREYKKRNIEELVAFYNTECE